MINNDTHKELALKAFNETWTLIDKKDRTHNDDINMMHMAHASRYHWGLVGTPLEFERGEWQISRVYALIGFGEQALFHARECLILCQKNNIEDFDLAFAYEAVARAYYVLGDRFSYEIYKEKALEFCKSIKDEENKKHLISEINSIE